MRPERINFFLRRNYTWSANVNWRLRGPRNKESLAVNDEEKRIESRERKREKEIQKTRKKRVKRNRFVFADKRSPRTLIAFHVNARDREICHGCPGGARIEKLWLKAWYVWLLKFLRRVKLCGIAARRRGVTIAIAVITDSEDFQVPIPIGYIDIPADERSLISWHTPLSRSYV